MKNGEIVDTKTRKDLIDDFKDELKMKVKNKIFKQKYGKTKLLE